MNNFTKRLLVVLSLMCVLVSCTNINQKNTEVFEESATEQESVYITEVTLSESGGIDGRHYSCKLYKAEDKYYIDCTGRYDVLGAEITEREFESVCNDKLIKSLELKDSSNDMICDAVYYGASVQYSDGVTVGNSNAEVSKYYYKAENIASKYVNNHS